MKLMLCFLILILSLSPVLALSGVNPRSYELNFKGGYNGEFKFDFTFDDRAPVNLHVEGDLAKYVTLNKKRIYGKGEVLASLHLPKKLDKPGVNLIKVVADREGLNVVGLIKLNVPYPSKFAELELRAPNANVGDEVNISLRISDRGNESIDAHPRIWIYQKGRVIDSWGFRERRIAPGNSEIFNLLFDSSNYSAGDYSAVAVVDYNGKTARAENPFRLGELSVRILNYTSEFDKGRIERFEISVENLWNNNLKDLYAEVNIPGFENANFVTQGINLKAWGTGTLVGALNTAKINKRRFKAEVTLHYGGKEDSEIIELRIRRNPSYAFWTGISILIVFSGGWLWKRRAIGRRRRKKASRNSLSQAKK